MNKKTTLFLLILTCFTHLAFSQDDYTEPIGIWIERALFYNGDGDYEEAIRQLDKYDSLSDGTNLEFDLEANYLRLQVLDKMIFYEDPDTEKLKQLQNTLLKLEKREGNMMEQAKIKVDEIKAQLAYSNQVMAWRNMSEYKLGTVELEQADESYDEQSQEDKSAQHLEKGITALTEAADKGNTLAMTILGETFIYNSSADSKENGFDWLKRAASLGNSEAMFRLGLSYCGFNGRKADIAEATYWFKKSAEKGNPSAAQELGGIYSKLGHFGNFDEEALYWLKVADAKLQKNQDGSIGIANHIAEFIYTSSHGGDIENTIKWYKKYVSRFTSGERTMVAESLINAMSDKTDYRYEEDTEFVKQLRNAFIEAGYLEK